MWHLSLAVQDLQRKAPVPVLRWSLTMVRKIEAIKQRIMGMCGTAEAVIPVSDLEMAWALGANPVAMQWRKPLSIEEINRMAPTAEVRERRGRP